jgi:dTDP-4-amino-4,6-dideoxy-D-galactose acyltransferase
MNLFQILNVDSEVFGFPVAKIIPDKLTLGELEQVISCLKKENVRLAFWASNPNDEESQRAARLYNGFLADKKVTYIIDIGQIPERSAGIARDIEEYADTLPCADLENLAIQVGRNSRFGADPRMPEDKFVALYKLWIRNSVNRQVADAVLVVRQSSKVVGMVTVGMKDGRGNIGLFAVDPGMRGKNLGVSLVYAAQEWARQKELKFAQVVTQGKNVAACRLYEKCGYHIDKIEFFYHFWI